ncbi:hypothetical protein MTR62_08015 [Novosphingobium sp. 1949]|uniref:Uncharacterized protein n=1 Tax=Novosphingobium organovorum TaxID=2930092 RepID=A0ABT0BC57_9SPHN|nr:hypothetical protein [Novosphingobium organovorum]MCJ2182636.1 hypothetical protein [Novosphingobium organovorum]
MLERIWQLRGVLVLHPGVSDDLVFARIESFLDAQNKRVTRGGANYAEFAGLPLPRRHRALSFFDRGRFWIRHNHDGKELHFELRSLYRLALCLVLVTALLATLAALDWFDTRALIAGTALAVALGGLYTLNAGFARARAPRAIYGAISGE